MSLHCHVVLFKGLVTLVSSAEGVVVRRVVGVAAPESVAARANQRCVPLQFHDPHRGPLVLPSVCHVGFHFRHVVLWINVYVNARRKNNAASLARLQEKPYIYAGARES